MDILVPSKIGIALDIDGTMFDTNRECYKRTCEVWTKTYGAEFPLNYEQFYSFRPKVKKVQDYFNLSLELMKQKGIVSPAEIDTEALTKLFYDYRKEKQASDEAGWLAENPPYENIPKMMEQLGQTPWEIFASTSKDGASVKKLLENSGMHIDTIYDKDVGGRKEQFARACQEKGLESRNIITYDDILGQLLEARSIGVTPVWAPQGYGVKADIEKEAIVSAWPHEFVPLAEKLLSSR